MYVIYPVLRVDIYVISLFVLMESKKTKKIAFFPLCRVPPWHSAKLGSRDPISQLCRVPEPWHSAKIFFLKKKKNSLPSARVWHPAKNFQKKENSLPSAAEVALGKEAVRFDVGFFLPSADVTLGKGFTEYSICGTRQRNLCQLLFAECGIRQSLYRVYFGLCRVPQALGKLLVSSSVAPKNYNIMMIT